MYQYFNGLVIREGTEGVPAEGVEALFEDAGWARNTPDWQNEGNKRTRFNFRNSRANNRNGIDVALKTPFY